MTRPVRDCAEISDPALDRCGRPSAEPCAICGRPVTSYVPMTCCNSHECECRGRPVNPCICSNACGNALMTHIGMLMDERRIAAGIPLWTPDDTTLRQADRAPGSTGGTRPVAPLFTDPEDGPRHPAIIALAVGMVIITGLSVLGLLVVAAVQIWKAVTR